jgi:hypothetical protein
MASKRLICDIHDEIMKISKSIEDSTYPRHINNMSEEEMRDMLDDINSRVNDIYYLTEEAKEYGQHMETRLRDYFDTISSLGFDRNNK